MSLDTIDLDAPQHQRSANPAGSALTRRIDLTTLRLFARIASLRASEPATHPQRTLTFRRIL